MADRVDTMRIGGFVMLGLAAGHLIERFVLSFWLNLDTSPGKTFGFAIFDALLGLAMLQGSEAARKAVLWITAFAAGALGLGIGGLFAQGFGHLWPVLGCASAIAVGVFALNFSREPRLPVVAAALSLVVVGFVGSVLATIFLAGTLDLATLNLIRQWSSPDRSFLEQEADLEIKAPPGWVMLKKGNPVRDQDKALVTLANTEIISFAQMFADSGTYSSADSLEYFLNGILKAKKAEAQGEVEDAGRADTRIGDTPARRMKLSWLFKKTPMLLYVTAWQDGDVFYHLELLGPGMLAKRLDADLEGLEKAISFGGPWTAFLRDRAAPVRAACPLLSEKAILHLARVIGKEPPPEAFCREGYRLAFKGQPLVDAESGERLKTHMRAFFDAIPRGAIGRYGAYVERLRAGQATTAAEDREMMEVARVALQSLGPETQDALRGSLAMAIEMGRFQYR
jgi:hypothetical protein